MTKLIENWFIGRKTDPFQAPETAYNIICGIVDGVKIATSMIVDNNGRMITTASGTVYELGEISQDYLNWMKENDIPYDCDNPIKTVDKLNPKVGVVRES